MTGPATLMPVKARGEKQGRDPWRLNEKARLRQLREDAKRPLAVNAWGYVRATRDVDIVPDPSRENLERLDSLLKELGGKVDVEQGLPQIPGFAVLEADATDVLAIGTTSRRWKAHRALKQRTDGRRRYAFAT